MKNDIFNLLRMLEQKAELLRDTFGETDFLDAEINAIWQIIENEYGTDPHNDIVVNALGDFGCGEIEKQALIKILKKHGKKLANTKK